MSALQRKKPNVCCENVKMKAIAADSVLRNYQPYVLGLLGIIIILGYSFRSK